VWDVGYEAAPHNRSVPLPWLWLRHQLERSAAGLSDVSVSQLAAHRILDRVEVDNAAVKRRRPRERAYSRGVSGLNTRSASFQ
jgi:hypothetical protein